MKTNIEISSRGLKPKSMSIHTIFACMDGQSIFSLAEGNLILFQKILEFLKEQDYSTVVDIDDSDVQHPDLTRLSLLFRLKTFNHVTLDGKAICKSYIDRILPNAGARDMLTKIVELTDNYCIMDEFYDHDDFVKVLSNASRLSCKELNRCFKESKSTKLLKVLNWPRDREILTYRSNSCVPDKSEIEAMV